MCLILLAGVTLTACDDGEELSTDQYGNEIKLNSFGPCPVLRGGVLKFLGSNLDQITEVDLPGADPITAIDIKAAANTLHFKNIGRNKLFEILRNAKILMWNNLPYQKYVDCGYFRTIEQKYTTHDGVKISIKTLVYQKGMDFIRRTLNNLGYKQVEQ